VLLRFVVAVLGRSASQPHIRPLDEDDANKDQDEAAELLHERDSVPVAVRPRQVSRVAVCTAHSKQPWADIDGVDAAKGTELCVIMCACVCT
jgi:hypothetical protein